MMDPISDMLIRIKNAARAKLKSVVLPHSELKYSIAGTLMKEGFLDDAQRKTKKVGKRSLKNLELTLAYANGEPKVHDLKRVSKLSQRVYMKKGDLHPVRKSASGIAVISTSKGVMTTMDAKKAGIGGEVIFEVW